MLAIRTILVPTDFSEPAEAALDYALALAAPLGGIVHLLSVVDLQGPHLSDLGAALTTEMIDTILAGNRAALVRLAEAHRGRGKLGELLLRTGDPRDVIDEVARQLHADLIVMGTHGRRGLRRIMMGSVAETLVRTASCPVLTVRPPL